MKFGQYELLERVAIGGMAEVYRGRVAGAEGFEKWVAIKRILPEFARDERFISMMLTEARIHSALSHRNIVQIHDLGISEDGEYFIVLEYVEGHDLRAIMEAAAELGVQIPDSLALHVADELAQALHFAHELKDPEGQPLGIIHRDVSPSNVLISNSGEVKLSDFGIAKRRHDHSFVGSLKGNLVYMSPEQARRVPLDRRTDVFSLGAVLFEMLTGQKVREIRDEVSGFRDVASGVVRSARALRPDLPESYEALLSRALASNPADRFQDAAAFGAAIRELRREHDAPVGPADMKELVELLNPPRRARSPVERSKVIRLGPEFKVLADHGPAAKSTEVPQAKAEQLPVILAPATGPTRSATLRVNGHGGGNTGWADGLPAAQPAPTPPPAPAPVPVRTSMPARASVPPARSSTATRSSTPARVSTSARNLTPAQMSMMGATPPPPILSGPRDALRTANNTAQFDAADAALHALEFSAGSDMQPTPPPPAVQGPYAPEVVTPIAASVPARRQAAEHVGISKNFAPPDMALSAPTPPPRAGITHPGLGLGPNSLSRSFDKQARVPSPAGGLRTDGALSRPFALTTGPNAAILAPPRGRGSWLSIVVVLLVILSATVTVVHYKVLPLDVLAVWLKPAALTLASDPAGASVTLDGRALPSLTPMSVDVRRDRLDHLLEFTRTGSLSVRATIRFDRSVALSQAVSLPPAPMPPPSTPPMDALPPPPPPVTAEEPAPRKSQPKSDKRAARKAAKSNSKRGAGKQLARKKAKEGKRARKVSKKSEDAKAAEL